MQSPLQNELLALLEKAKAGNATGDDYARLAAIINADDTGELIAEADSFFAQEAPVPAQHIDPYDHDHWQQAFSAIKASWQQQHPPAVVRRFPQRRWLAAASILLLISAGTYFLLKTPATQPLAATTTQILPGSAGAILTLANGSRILLDTIQNGVVALQNGITAKIVNDTLVYEGNSNKAVYNEMSTPKARRFTLILPDGTKAWLNSASSIKYPTAFTGNEREVRVSGEVYFEVAKLSLSSGKKMPFKVVIPPRPGGQGGATIEVLGTHFNVKAYDNEPVINTTLLEGSIAISLPAKSKPALILKPGQQAQMLVGKNQLQVVDVHANNAAEKKTTTTDAQPGLTVLDGTDIDKVMAWKNGVFDFNDIEFVDAMAQLERWYDIEVVYEKDIPEEIELSGKITKDVTLNDMVIILEKIGVKCKLEGRKLLIQS